jgi:putative membrane protein
MWWGDVGTGGWWWLGMGLGWTMMVLFWGAVVALVMWPVRRTADRAPASPGPTSHGRSPLEIAQGRYPQGGIGREEFQQIRADLAR